jgi:hypothetical protein
MPSGGGKIAIWRLALNPDHGRIRRGPDYLRLADYELQER